jgi:hypothetical protein
MVPVYVLGNPVVVQVMLCVSPNFQGSPPFGEVMVIDGWIEEEVYAMLQAYL